MKALETSTPEPARPNEDEQKAIALELLLDAWDEALARGCTPELLATSAIFAALTDMVDLYGEGPVADMAEGLPERIRRGEFSMNDGETH
jgi:hypothetical protein